MPGFLCLSQAITQAELLLSLHACSISPPWHGHASATTARQHGVREAASARTAVLRGTTRLRSRGHLLTTVPSAYLAKRPFSAPWLGSLPFHGHLPKPSVA